MSSAEWSKMFPALSICRLDLVNAGCNREQVAALTDEQMQHIAEAIDNYIEDYAFEEGEWEEIVCFIVRVQLAEIAATQKPHDTSLVAKGTDVQTSGTE